VRASLIEVPLAVTSSVLFLFHCKLSAIAAVHTSGNTPRLTALMAGAETVQQTSCALARASQAYVDRIFSVYGLKYISRCLNH